MCTPTLQEPSSGAISVEISEDRGQTEALNWVQTDAFAPNMFYKIF